MKVASINREEQVQLWVESIHWSQNNEQERGWKGRRIYEKEGEDKKERLFGGVCFSGRQEGKPKKIK